MSSFRGAPLLVALALILAACGSGTEITAQNQASTTEPSAQPSTTAGATDSLDDAEPTNSEGSTSTPAVTVEYDLPSIELTDMATGEPVNLAAVADGKPLVLWFWAPH